MKAIATIGKYVIGASSVVGFKVQQHAPEILIGCGLVGMGITTVKACKATLKVNEEIKKGTEILNNVDGVMKGEIPVRPGSYSAEDARDDKILAWRIMGQAVVKHYGPVAAIGTASVVSILCGYNILNKRNAALIAAYTAIDTSFKKYRQRVVEDLGEEADWKYRTGATEKKVDTVEVDENGKEKKVKAKVETVDPAAPIDYMVDYLRDAIYIPTDVKRNKQMVKWQIQQIETNANTRLQTYKHLTLNDVYDMLGVPRRDCGQIVGWTLDGAGDNAVRFMVKEVWDEEFEQDNFLIDFNVDGIIFDKIEKVRDIV